MRQANALPSEQSAFRNILSLTYVYYPQARGALLITSGRVEQDRRRCGKTQTPNNPRHIHQRPV